MVILNVNPIISNVKAENLAGDLNQLPENEKLLDLSNGNYDVSSYGDFYFKNNTFVNGLIVDPNHPNYLPPENLFNHQHSSAYTSSGHVYFHFSTLLKISRIRLYPMDEEGNIATGVNIFRYLFEFGLVFRINSSSFSSITDESDYLEFKYNNLVTSCLSINWQGDNRFNEIEIYYDPLFNPYYYTSQVNNTNITNEYYNETNVLYQNDTYVNNTYLNNTYENSTTQNVTYLNVTNQTMEKEFFNTTNEYSNYTYFNESILADNQRLEDKINDLWKQLNETEDVEIRKSNSLADDTYTDPILLILLLIVVVFQIIIFLRGRRKEEPPIENDNIEAEIEHTPSRGFTKEGEVDIIARKVQEERSYQEEPTPSVQTSTSYHHRNNDPSMSQSPQPQAEEHRPEINVTLPPQSPPRPPPTPPQSMEQKALPEHNTNP